MLKFTTTLPIYNRLIYMILLSVACKSLEGKPAVVDVAFVGLDFTATGPSAKAVGSGTYAHIAGPLRPLLLPQRAHPRRVWLAGVSMNALPVWRCLTNETRCLKCLESRVSQSMSNHTHPRTIAHSCQTAAPATLCGCNKKNQTKPRGTHRTNLNKVVLY